MNYRSFTALLACKQCGAALPLPGPVRAIKCAACQADHELTAEQVADYIYFACRGTVTGEVTPMPAQGHPCPSCGAKLDLGGFPAGLETTIHCKSCSSPITAFPPPAWLRPLLPTLEMIIGGARDVSDLPYRPPTATGEAPAPSECWSVAFEPRELQRASDIADDDRRAKERAAEIDHKRRVVEEQADREAREAREVMLAKQATARAARIVAYIITGAVLLGVILLSLR